MSDQVRLMSPPPSERRRRTTRMVAAASIALVAIVSGLAQLSHTGSGPQPKATPASPGGPATTDREYALARNLVRDEIRQIDAFLTSATVTHSQGTEPNSNVGYPCMSGSLLRIKLIGDFPHITVSPMPPQPGVTTPGPTVHAEVLTADAKSGRLCLIGVQTGKVAPEPGAESLPFDWLGFLGTARLK